MVSFSAKLGTAVCLASPLLLSGCDDRVTITFSHLEVLQDLQLRTTSGQTVIVKGPAEDLPDPEPGVPGDVDMIKTREKFGLAGDRKLCGNAGSLTTEESLRRESILRRLRDIHDELEDTRRRFLLAGQMNTMRETPECEPFLSEVIAIAQFFPDLVKREPTPPRPNPPVGSERTVTNIEWSQRNAKVFALVLSDGSRAEFGLGKSPESLRDSIADVTVSPSTTGQGIGLFFDFKDNDFDSDEYTSEESCTYERRRTVCVDGVCKEIIIRDPGVRTVTYHSSTYTKWYDVSLFRADLSKTIATTELTIREFSSYSSNGPCRPEF